MSSPGRSRPDVRTRCRGLGMRWTGGTRRTLDRTGRALQALDDANLRSASAQVRAPDSIVLGAGTGRRDTNVTHATSLTTPPTTRAWARAAAAKPEAHSPTVTLGGRSRSTPRASGGAADTDYFQAAAKTSLFCYMATAGWTQTQWLPAVATGEVHAAPPRPARRAYQTGWRLRCRQGVVG